ncbi:zinc finger protein 502-like [Colletotrichum incanum]|uniref:Zinc finger protein 502-like n=1 Tax=Colletotrichum incanum TaxID=1573173 RepID=A0A161WJJ2_COLIC|nr:zinc finger protein 502-like [Colletotrichum incanum]
MLFSPFDALGLTWGEYGAREISLAYKRAALVCHPDKRERNGIQSHRWPQMWQLEEAKKYLSYATVEEFKKFEGFPRTFFFPEEKPPYFRIPQPLPGRFKHCDICEVVVLSDDFAEHLREHQKTICSECDKREQLDDIGDHLTRFHDYRTCHHCQTLRAPAEHNDHIAKYHQCPLCDMDQAFIINHLEEAHQLHICKECGGDNPVTHVITVHPATECTGCNNIIFDDVLLYHLQEDHGLMPCHICHAWETAIELWDHVLTDHGLDRCLLCTASFVGSYPLDAHLARVHDIRTCVSCPPGRSFDMEHVLSRHSLEPCPDCKTTIQSDGLQMHLIAHHKWILCGACGLASPNMQAFRAHEDHHPVCEVCDERITQENLQGHLRDRHELLCCPLCDKAFSPAGLPRHFQTAHHQTELCPECQCPRSRGDLNDHVIESHGWLQCHFCDDVFPDEGQRTNHEEHGHDTKPCWHCDQVIPESQMRSHQIQEHGYKGCPICPSLSKDLSSHIQRHKQESATMHHQLSAINDKLQQFAALQPSSKALLYQAAKYIKQAILVENQGPAGINQGFTALEDTQHTQAQGAYPTSARVRQPSFRNETVESPSSIAEQSPNGDLGEENSLRRSGRQQSGRKRALLHSFRPVNTQRKKTRSFVPRRAGLSDVLEKATSQETVEDFVAAVKSNHPLDPLQPQEPRPTSQSDYESIFLISQFADKCEHQAGCAKIWHYYAVLQMAQLVDRTKKDAGRQRVDSAELDKILEHKQCEANDYSRNKLRNQLQLGRKLQRISGPFVGLLCFLAVGQADIGKGLSFTDDDLKRFQVGLSAHENLWAAGGEYLRLWHTGVIPDAEKIREITGLIRGSNCLAGLEDN